MRTRASQLSSDEPLRTRQANAATSLVVAPSGTGVGASIVVTSASDVLNSPRAVVSADGTQINITADRSGTGAYQSMAFNVGGAARVFVDTSGRVGVNAIPSIANAALTVQALSAGSTQAVNIAIPANTSSDLGGFHIVNNANAVRAEMWTDALNGVTRVKSLGDLHLHAGSVGFSAANQVLSMFAATMQVQVNPQLGASTIALIVSGSQNQYAQLVYGHTTSGQSLGLQIAAGTTVADWAFFLSSRSSTPYLSVRGDGAVLINQNQSNLGAVTPFNVYGSNSTTAYWAGMIYGSPSSNASMGLMILAGTYNLSSSSEQAFTVYTRDAAHRSFVVTGPGSVQVNPDANVWGFSSNVLNVIGSGATQALTVYGYNSTSQSWGASIYAGTNSSDNSFIFYNRAANTAILQGRGDYYVWMAGPLQTNTSLQSGQAYAFQSPNVANISGRHLAQQYDTYSTINTKSQVATIGSRALELLDAVRGVSYLHHYTTKRRAKNAAGVWDTAVDHFDTPSYGFIGEEVMQHIPEVISRDPAGNLAMSYERMVPILWEAVKELSAKVAALQSQNQPQQGGQASA
jgi:hypothetical protein